MRQPSTRNADKIHRGRMILPNLSRYSWPKAIRYNIHPFSRCPHRDNLASSSVISCYRPSKFGRLCSFFLQISSFPTREHITEQGLLLRTDTAQLLFRSFPMPALHYNPKPSISPTKFRHLEKCRKFRFFETAPKRSPWHSKHASACQSYENEQISTKMTDDCRNFPTKTRSSKTTP